MTEKEMDKLADTIVSKLIKKQAEYDAMFMEELVKNAGPEYDVTVEFNKTDASVEAQIKYLEDQIHKCIETDNFEAIVSLQEQIKKLSDGEN
jgi:uncharacterized protein YajQ (UPF0234 family)